MASRLDEDANKGAKWADIDEDDDDWVPSKLEWSDGTALTAAPVVKEEPPSPPPQPEPEPEPIRAPVAPPIAAPVRQATPVAAPARQTTPVLATKLSGKPKTLITEKPSTKVADAAATTAPKASPWAKIVVPTSPVITAPPVHQRQQASEQHHSYQPQQAYQSHQSHRYEDRSREAYPAAEVSAEAYDRTWRDRRGSANQRELFNSQTGQMEPVQDGPSRNPRMGRNEPPVSKPAVLQRPSQGPGPAEPSSSFQQSRVPMRQDDYRRRRTSSNVSGGSGAMGRRESFTRFGSEAPNQADHGYGNQSRHASVFDDGPARMPPHRSPLVQHREMHVSPRAQNVQPAQAVAPLSPVMASVQPILAQGVDPASVLAEQERVMREAREHARKRKQEEEAREEAAKKERLRIKLEALEQLALEKAAAKKAEEDRIAAEKAKIAEEKRIAEEQEQAAAAAAAAEKAAALEQERLEKEQQAEQQRQRDEAAQQQQQQQQRDKESAAQQQGLRSTQTQSYQPPSTQRGFDTRHSPNTGSFNHQERRGNMYSHHHHQDYHQSYNHPRHYQQGNHRALESQSSTFASSTMSDPLQAAPHHGSTFNHAPRYQMPHHQQGNAWGRPNYYNSNDQQGRFSRQLPHNGFNGSRDYRYHQQQADQFNPARPTYHPQPNNSLHTSGSLTHPPLPSNPQMENTRQNVNAAQPPALHNALPSSLPGSESREVEPPSHGIIGESDPTVPIVVTTKDKEVQKEEKKNVYKNFAASADYLKWQEKHAGPGRGARVTAQERKESLQAANRWASVPQQLAKAEADRLMRDKVPVIDENGMTAADGM